MSTLKTNGIVANNGTGPIASLPQSGGSNFQLGPNWGAWEFVSGTDLTVITNLDFTSLAAGYDYQILLQGVSPTTDAQLLYARFSQSASFLSGASDYTDGTTDGSTQIDLCFAITAANDEHLNMELSIPEPNVASRRKKIFGTAAMGRSANNLESFPDNTCGRLDANLNACDGVRLFWASGTWQAVGKAYLFRRRLS